MDLKEENFPESFWLHYIQDRFVISSWIGSILGILFFVLFGMDGLNIPHHVFVRMVLGVGGLASIVIIFPVTMMGLWRNRSLLKEKNKFIRKLKNNKSVDSYKAARNYRDVLKRIDKNKEILLSTDIGEMSVEVGKFLRNTKK